MQNKDKTHCPQGHEYTEQNTRVTPKNIRQCRACDRDRAKIKRAPKFKDYYGPRRDLEKIGLKECNKCHRSLSFNNFAADKTSRDNLRYDCKECVAAYHKEYRENNKERLAKQGRDKSMRKKYGISADEYDTMLSDQGFLCKICNKDISEGYYLDHCHKTMALRGFLCYRCNVGLGYFQDNIDLMEAATMYLRQSKKGE